MRSSLSKFSRLRAQMLAGVGEKVLERSTDKVITALNVHINDLKPGIEKAIGQVEIMRAEVMDRVDKVVIPTMEKQVTQMREAVTDKVTEVTDRVTEMLGSLTDIFRSTKKTTDIISRLMDVICSISSVVTFVGEHTVLHGIAALWSIWKVIKICLDLFPTLKTMSEWKETAEASMEVVPDDVFDLRHQSGNSLLTGLGFAAVVTKFMPPWVVKTLDTFSRNSRYRVLEDLSWLGDAVGIILEIPAFVITWVADNFQSILKQSVVVERAVSNNFTDSPRWRAFNDALQGMGIPEKLRECAECYQVVICKLPGTRLHRVAREAEAFITRAMDDYRILAERPVLKEVKELVNQLDVLVGSAIQQEGRVPESIKDTVRKIRDLYRVSLSMTSQIRQVPVWLILAGPPGCGKSYLLSQALTQMGKSNGVYYYVNNNPQKDYNDLYMGQAIWVHEEMGRRGGYDYSHYIDHVSVMPSPLDAAELTRKQMLTFQSKLIACSSNDNILRCNIQFNKDDMVKEPEAVYRRILVADCSQFRYDSQSGKYEAKDGDGLMHFFKYNYDERRYYEVSSVDPNDMNAFIEYINGEVEERQVDFHAALKKSEEMLDIKVVDFNKDIRAQFNVQPLCMIKNWFCEARNVAWDISLGEMFDGTSWSNKFINGVAITKSMLSSTIGYLVTKFGEVYASSTVKEYVDWMQERVKVGVSGVAEALKVVFDKLGTIWNGVWDKYLSPHPIVHPFKDGENQARSFSYVRFVVKTGSRLEGEVCTEVCKKTTIKVPIGTQIKDVLPQAESTLKEELFVNPMMYNYRVQGGYDGITIECQNDGGVLKSIWKWFVNSVVSHPVVLSSILLTIATVGIWFLTRNYGAVEYKRFSKVNFPRPPAPRQRHRLRPQVGGEKLNVIMDNTLRATVSTSGQVVNATIVMLDSLHALIPAHCITNIDHTVCMTPYISGENRNGQQMFKHKFEVLEIDLMEDYALLKVVEPTVHLFRDMKKRFIQEIQNTECVLVAGSNIVKIGTPSFVDVNAPYFSFRSGTRNIKSEIHQGFVYNYQEDGICGALICTLEGQVIGWHVATDDVQGYGRAFRPRLLSVIGGMVEVQQTVGVVSAAFAGAIPIASTGYRAIQKGSRIAPSKMQQHMQAYDLTGPDGLPERVPARIDEPGVDAFKRSQEKNLVPGKPVDRDALEFAVAYMKNMLAGITKGKKLDVLSEMEMVKGRTRNKTTSSTLRRVDPKSSAGIPWGALNGDLLDYEEGTINRDVKIKMDYIMKQARAGVRVENEIIFKDCWKDELRLVEKQYKPRLFAAGPLHYTLLLRKYFGHLCELFMDARLETGVMIGINALSKEWDTLCKKLSSLPNIFSGDYKSWDGAMVKEFEIELNKLMSELTVEPDAVNVLLSYLYETQREGKDVAYMTTHSIPSGHGLTALYNSLINKMYIAYAWYLCVGKDLKLGVMQKIVQFKRDVYAVVYGDDVLVTVADSIKHRFNAVAYAQIMDAIGLGFTTAMKGVVTLPFERMEDVTFLKRSFVFNKKTRCTTGPLEMYILRSTVGWVNDPTLDEFLIKAKMDSVQRECFLNPVGDHLWSQMMALFETTYGYKYDALSDTEMLELFNRGELDGDVDSMSYEA